MYIIKEESSEGTIVHGYFTKLDDSYELLERELHKYIHAYYYDEYDYHWDTFKGTEDANGLPRLVSEQLEVEFVLQELDKLKKFKPKKKVTGE